MIKKLIKFDDFDGNQIEEEHYFHLSKTELLKMDAEKDGGMVRILSELQASNNANDILRMFSEIIMRAYGRRDPLSPTRFIKDASEQQDFLQSLACEALLTECTTDPNAAVEFINGISPKDLRDAPEVKSALEGVKNVELPDPNGLDKAGAWPTPEISVGRDDPKKIQTENTASGLQVPRDKNGKLWPWWNREPTQKELTEMPHNQMLDVFRRKSTSWVPIVG